MAAGVAGNKRLRQPLHVLLLCSLHWAHRGPGARSPASTIFSFRPLKAFLKSITCVAGLPRQAFKGNNNGVPITTWELESSITEREALAHKRSQDNTQGWSRSLRPLVEFQVFQAATTQAERNEKLQPRTPRLAFRGKGQLTRKAKIFLVPTASTPKEP